MTGTQKRRITRGGPRSFLGTLVSHLSSLVHRLASPVPCAATRLPGVLSAVLFLAIIATSSPAPAVLLDRIVASVNNDVITLSELEQAVRFNEAMGGGNGAGLRTETLEGLINRQLLLQEAYRLKFVEVSDREIQEEIEKLRKRVGPGDAFARFLARLDMTEQQVGRMLGERLLVEKFVEKKIGLFVRVSREEAQDYFKTHSAEFRGKSFPEVKKTITGLLTSRKFEEQEKQYLAELRSKADIRINP